MRKTRERDLGDARKDWTLPNPIDPQQYGDGLPGTQQSAGIAYPPNLSHSTNQPSCNNLESSTKLNHQQQSPLWAYPSSTAPPAHITDFVVMDQDGLLKPAAVVHQHNHHVHSNLLPSKRPFSADEGRPNNPLQQQEQYISSCVSISTKGSQPTNESSLSGTSSSPSSSGAIVHPAPITFGEGVTTFPDRLLPQTDDPSATTGFTSLLSVSTTASPLQQYQSSSILYPSRKEIVPKSELHVFYAKQFKKILSNANYHVWHNAVEAHQLKWTSVFVCPCTGELFLSGRYPCTEAEREVVGKLCWYTKKVHAEHAAAACALECWSFRNQPVPIPLTRETPYRHVQEGVFRLPDTVPEAIRVTIYAQQAEIRREQHLPSLT